MDIINTDLSGSRIPFDSVLRKLNRRINTGRVKVRDTASALLNINESNLGEIAQSIEKGTENIDFSEDKKRTNSPENQKQKRILSIIGKVQSISQHYGERKQRIVADRVTKLSILLQNKLNESRHQVFQDFIYEISIDCRNRNNYVSRMKSLKQHTPKVVVILEKIIQKIEVQDAFSELRATSIISRFEETKRLLALLSGFKGLTENAKKEKETKLQSKLMGFMMKLDTYVILLKYNSFFTIKLMD